MKKEEEKFNILNILKGLKENFDKVNAPLNYNNHFLCNICEFIYGYGYASEFRKYLKNNHVDGGRYVVFKNNKERLKWLKKHIKLNS